MNSHTITIEINTDADDSLILELAIAAAEKLIQDIEDHDHEASFNEDDVSVTSD